MYFFYSSTVRKNKRQWEEEDRGGREREDREREDREGERGEWIEHKGRQRERERDRREEGMGWGESGGRERNYVSL